MENYCAVCSSALAGRQKRFCSQRCKHSFTNNKLQNYTSQQQRGVCRRSELSEMKGGRCDRCGYRKNHAALCFHHVDPSDKSFQIDLRQCSNRSWNALVAEAAKCRLLCLNCHAETHNPGFST
ncbi:MAG: DUF2116 family Zn-ribbon domain-containing protein [Pyrinomonadaceae bacterium]